MLGSISLDVSVHDILVPEKHLTYREKNSVQGRCGKMDRNEWLVRAEGTTLDSYGKLLDMMSRLEEDIDPKFTPEQAEFFKSLITGLIDTIRSFKYETKR